MNKKLMFIFLIFCTNNLIYCSSNALAKLYSLILGNNDVSSIYKEQTIQALDAFKIKSPEEVQVKQMNGVGPAFARLDLTSFTAFGVWLNEKLLNLMNEEEKTFQIYHEAAHYYAHHLEKLLLGNAVILLSMGVILKKINDYLKSQSTTPIVRYSSLGALSFATLAGLYFYLLPNVVKYQEKEADLLAAQALINSGNKNIVEAHIDGLKQIQENDNIWWHSTADQINYLEKVA